MPRCTVHGNRSALGIGDNGENDELLFRGCVTLQVLRVDGLENDPRRNRVPFSIRSVHKSGTLESEERKERNASGKTATKAVDCPIINANYIEGATPHRVGPIALWLASLCGSDVREYPFAPSPAAAVGIFILFPRAQSFVAGKKKTDSYRRTGCRVVREASRNHSTLALRGDDLRSEPRRDKTVIRPTDRPTDRLDEVCKWVDRTNAKGVVVCIVGSLWPASSLC
jgi:hypothetical protein